MNPADLATNRLETELARRGVDDEAIAGLLGVVDRSRLVRDGMPDRAALGALVAAMAPQEQTGAPDPTQGQGSQAELVPVSFGSLISAAIRRAAGY